MSGMSTTLTNARLVLADGEIERGWLRIESGQIAALGEGDPAEAGESLAGDVLIPGLVELHTDHLETHYAPRPAVRWSPFSSVLSYDAQIAASGITTVFDSFRVGSDADSGSLGGEIWKLADAVRSAADAGHLRVDHRTHLRCELASPDVLETAEAFVERYSVDLISLMDHTPGQRQFRSLDAWRRFYTRKSPMSAEELEGFIAKRLDLHERFAQLHRRRLVELARANGIALASHDDTTAGHVEESLSDGIAVAEFPTTQEAAQASHGGGMRVMMGAPNLVRGGSHSGNVGAIELAEGGVLDILSSDYVPASLLMAAFLLPARVPAITLHEAIRTVTRTPALATGLDDRGALEPGLRADLVRVHLSSEGPVVRRVWRQGQPVA